MLSLIGGSLLKWRCYIELTDDPFRPDEIDRQLPAAGQRAFKLGAADRHIPFYAQLFCLGTRCRHPSTNPAISVNAHYIDYKRFSWSLFSNEVPTSVSCEKQL